MKLAMFMMPLHPPGRQPSETLAEDREAILLADRLGFAEAYVGEHVTDLAENVTSCLMFLASLAHDTKQIVLGTRHDQHAEHATRPRSRRRWRCSITCSKGRFIMGISPGGLMSDAEVFGNYQKDRNAIFLESINMVLDIWKGEGPYNLQGSTSTSRPRKTMIPEIGQGTILKPYQQPHPPIVVTAVAPHSKGVTEAAKRGWKPISANFLLPEWVAIALAALRRGLQGGGGAGRSGGLAGREVDLRRRRRERPRSATATRPKGRTTSTSSSWCASWWAAGGRSNLFKLDQNRARRRDHAGVRHEQAGDRRHGQQRGRPAARVPREDRRLRHAAVRVPRLDGPGARRSGRCS